MRCLLCDEKTKVLDSRYRNEMVVRVRECPNCLTRFKTQEKIDGKSLDDYVLNKYLEKTMGTIKKNIIQK